MALNTGIPRQFIREVFEDRLIETGIPYLTTDSLINETVDLMDSRRDSDNAEAVRQSNRRHQTPIPNSTIKYVLTNEILLHGYNE